MDYYTHNDIVKIFQQKNIIEIYTNKTGILCKQSSVNDKLRLKIFRNKKLCEFMQVFENVIINKHLQAMWLSYNRKYLDNVITNICYYFSYIEKSYIKQYLRIFITEQINHQTLEKIIQYIYNTNCQISEKINSKKYYYELSTFFLGKNFYISKTNIGIKKYTNNIYTIIIECNENEYNNILQNIDKKKVITQYIKNVYIKILIKTKITKKYLLSNCRLGFNFITCHYKVKNIYTVLV